VLSARYRIKAKETTDDLRITSERDSVLCGVQIEAEEIGDDLNVTTEPG
jgi:hypothetical protein